MFKELIPALRTFAALTVLTGVVYPLLVTAFAQLFPAQSQGDPSLIGQPFTDAGFGNKMREWCNQAGLPECSSHGLKKIAATICAEAGATDRQMMALFDWSSEKMAGVYTSKANKVRLAQAGAAALATFSLDALLAGENGNEPAAVG